MTMDVNGSDRRRDAASQAALDRLIEIAVAYSRRSWVVIPNKPRTKEPLYSGWSQPPYLTEEQIVARLREYHRNSGEILNLGILTGEPGGGLTDADLDCQEAVALAPYFLPPTPAIYGRASKLRSHYLYRIRSELAYRKFADPLLPSDVATLSEIRTGGNKQSLLPGSTHPSGETYAWSHGGMEIPEPAEVEAEVLVRQMERMNAAILLGRYWGGVATGRHDRALALAGGLYRLRWPLEEASDFVRAVLAIANDEEAEDRLRAIRDTYANFDTRHITGWPALEGYLGEHGPTIIRTVRDWLGAASGAPADIVPPFPVGIFPLALRRLIEEGAAEMSAPSDFIAGPVLVAIGTGIGSSLEIELKPGWREGANVYLFVVADPGAKKTPGINRGVEAIYAAQRRLGARYAAAQEAHERRLAEYENSTRAQRQQQGLMKPKPPEFSHVVTTDATMEALAPMLAGGRGVVLHKDEGLGWVKSMDAYRSGRGGDRQNYLSAWSRQTIKVDRKGNPEPIIVHRPSLSVVGGIQTDLLGELADAAAREDGFIDRLLWVFPDPVPDVWNEGGTPSATRLAVESLIWRLCQLPGRVEDRNGRSERQPWVVRLDPVAKAAWGEWYAAHSAEMASERFPTRLRGPWAKMPGQLARLTLILHAITTVSSADDQPEERRDHFAPVRGGQSSDLAPPTATTCPVPEDVSVETLRAAIQLVDYFKAHARRAYRRLARDRRDIGTTLLVALRERGVLSQTQISVEILRRNVPAGRIRSALEALEEAGLVVREVRAEPNHPHVTYWRPA